MNWDSDIIKLVFISVWMKWKWISLKNEIYRIINGEVINEIYK